MDNKISQFPNEWKIQEIKDSHIQIIDGDRGKNYPSKIDFSETGFCLFLNTGNIQDDKFVFNRCEFISEDKDHKLRKGKLQKGDIVLTTRGTVGSLAYYDQGITIENIRINSGMIILRCGSEINSQFLYQLLKSQTMKEQYMLYSSGAAQPQLPIRDFNRIKLVLPPLTQQEQIAAVLSAYDDLIETNNQRIATLEQLAQQIYKEWFVRMRFPGWENTQLHHGMPENWERKKLGEISSLISRGITPKYDENGESVVINQKCIRNGRLNLIPSQKQSKEIPNNKKIQKNDVLINSTGEGTLGRVARVVKNHENHTVDTHVTIARPDVEKIDPSYYGFTLLNYQNIFEFMVVGATGQTELGRKDIMNVEIELPTFLLQSRFAFLINPMVDQIDVLIEQNKVLTNTRNRLLPRLISGKLSIKQAEALAP